MSPVKMWPHEVLLIKCMKKDDITQFIDEGAISKLRIGSVTFFKE
jgi:hypothetical protein